MMAFRGTVRPPTIWPYDNIHTGIQIGTFLTSSNELPPASYQSPALSPLTVTSCTTITTTRIKRSSHTISKHPSETEMDELTTKFSPSAAKTLSSPSPFAAAFETKVLQSVQLSTAGLSFIASFLIAFMILRQTDSFHSPYRRIIFGLSCADILSSFALITGPFSAPRDSVDIRVTIGGGPFGNITTCNLNGFLFIIGSTAAPMYICSLCLYYFYKVIHNMSDRRFARKIEKGLHACIIIWSVGGAIVALATNNINPVPGGDFCYISSSPLNCEMDPLVDCDRGENFILFAIAISYAPNLFSFFGIVFTMLRIAYKVHAQERRNAGYRFLAGRRSSVISVPQVVNQEIPQAANQEIPAQRRQSLADIFRRALSSIFGEDIFAGNGQNNQNQDRVFGRDELAARARIRETYTQAWLYVMVFLIVYLWPYIFGICEAFDKQIPFEVSILTYVFYPLGGFLNILVYTRQKVATVRRRTSHFWIRCLWIVISKGGEAPAPPPRQPAGRRDQRRNRDNARRDDTDSLSSNRRFSTVGILPQIDEIRPTGDPEIDDLPSSHSSTILEDPPFQSSLSTTQEISSFDPIVDDDLSSGSEIVEIDDAASFDSRTHSSNGVQSNIVSLADNTGFEGDECNEFKEIELTNIPKSQDGEESFSLPV